MKLISSSNREAHSRYVYVYRGIAECDYCEKTKEILSVDTSDDEYRRFDCCLDCFTDLFKNAKDLE